MNQKRKDWFDKNDRRWEPKAGVKMKLYIVIYRYGKRIFREPYLCHDIIGIIEEIENQVTPPDYYRVFLDGKEVKL